MMVKGKNADRVVFALLGAHRSGTSLGARILEALGLPLGDDLIPGHADNPEGFWEHRGILEHTRAVEKHLDINPLHGSRLAPPAEKWWKNAPVVDHAKSLAGLLRSEVSRHGTFGFKDPRTLLLVSMWEDVFRRAKIEPVYIVLLRHPSAVARSYARRQGLAAEFGEYIWLLHWSVAVLGMSRPPAAVVHFENWMKNPNPQVQLLQDLLSETAGIEGRSHDVVGKLVQPGLSHYGNKEASTGLRQETVELYGALSEAGTPGAWERAREVAQRVLEQHGLVAPALESMATRARRVDHKVQQQKSEIEQLKQRLVRVQEKREQASGVNPAESVEPRPAAPYDAEFPDLQSFIDMVDGPGRKLKVCIATEDIVGPIRNGGIGTTYYYLAKMLAEAGHDTTIVYVRGDHCENESIEHWVTYYANFGVRFLALNPEDHSISSPASRWIGPMVALYDHLKAEHYDLVHVSEWRGTGYIAQTAKRQGLALQNTLFCVKTSSPWLWNREYGYHTLSDPQDLPKMHAERRSVELGDLVIGGSRHLLCWMLEHGYQLPAERTYVQPNVVVPIDLDDVASDRRSSYGKRIGVDEIVFFGRLEYRKGLDVFFDAIDILLAKGVRLPRIHLLGKIGEVIPSYSEFTTGEYIKFRTSHWPMPLEIHTDKNTEQALRFLLDGRRLAVMPSIIENSSLAVYETAYYAIPFLASHRGGTPELVLEKDRDEVLLEPHPVPLSEKIAHALKEGGYVARPSFNNRRNLATWKRFHAAAGAYIKASSESEEAMEAPSISLCLVVNNDHEFVSQVLDRLALEVMDRKPEIVICDNGSQRTETRKWLRNMAGRDEENIVVHELDAWGDQHAENHGARTATGDLLVFVRSGCFLKENYLDVLRQVASSSHADIFCCHFDEVAEQELADGASGVRQVFFADDVAYGFYDPDNISPVIAVRRDAFERMGGFREDFKTPAAHAEFVANANLENFSVVTIPESVAWQMSDYVTTRRMNHRAVPYRSIRPYIEHAPQCYSRVLMLGRDIARGTVLGRNAASGADPATVVDIHARELAGEMAGFSRLRAFGWRAYNAQQRWFHKALDFEIHVMRKMVRGWRSLRRR